MNIIIIGMPGSGKGTQAELLAKKYRLAHISTGDIFREEINRKTEIGKKADFLIKRGKLVPNEITNEIVRKKLTELKSKKGFILDGYPRNMVQAGFLDSSSKLDAAIFMEISDEAAKKRLMGRYSCGKCSRNYNIFTRPIPKKELLCDKCKIPLVQRDDDDEKSVLKRIEVYHRITEKLIPFYREKGILLEINGEQTVPAVRREIIKKLKELTNRNKK